MARSTCLVDPSVQFELDLISVKIRSRQDDETHRTDPQDEYVDDEKSRLEGRAKEIRETVTLLHKELNGIEEELSLLDELWIEKECELRKPR